ncbi:hypothetical protein [Myroides odoratus]|uniref:hypothetical protein n=1 Tax=Myroides odoratus TaxID=256 RepID=UPI003340A714
MIDFIKIEVPNFKVYEEKLTRSSCFNFKQNVEINGGILSYPLRAKYKNIDINITEKKVVISGSLHKFYNVLYFEEEQNYSKFYYCQLKQVISVMRELFSLDEIEYKINVLEIGFNIPVQIPVKDIINSKILMYDYKEHSKLNNYNNRGYLKEFSTSDYLIKIYDKGSQFSLTEDLIRFEVKIKRSRILRKFKIFDIADLLKESVLRRLFDFYMDRIAKLNIVDYDIYNSLASTVKANLDKWTNPNTWKTYKVQNYSYKQRINRKEKFEKLLKEKGLLKTKEQVINSLCLEYEKLLIVKNNRREGLSHIRHVENISLLCK